MDTEKIVGLGTDLVIAGGEGGTPQDAIDKLRSLKIPVLVLYAPDVDGVYKDIAATGDAVGESDKADALVASMKSRLRPGRRRDRRRDEAEGLLRDRRPAVDLRDRRPVRLPADDLARRRHPDHDRQRDELGDADREARPGRTRS